VDHALGHVVNRGWMVPAAFAAVGAVTSVVVGARARRLRREREKEGEQQFLFEEQAFEDRMFEEFEE
jgi:putative oxidoreductase